VRDYLIAYAPENSRCGQLPSYTTADSTDSALRAWLEAKGIMKPERKRAATRKRP
jgi:hypothetical protein